MKTHIKVDETTYKEMETVEQETHFTLDGLYRTKALLEVQLADTDTKIAKALELGVKTRAEIDEALPVEEIIE